LEEKILLPGARGAPLPVASAPRKDHGEIAGLLVRSRTPTPELCAQLRALLARHDPLEEGAAGLCAVCDGLAGAEAEEVVTRLQAQPPVPMAPYYDGPLGGGRG
jgi:hypothetical protein